MKPYTAMAHIHTLDGAIDEVTVLEKVENPNQPYYVVDYKGVKCTAIFNCFAGAYYADDKFGVITQ